MYSKVQGLIYNENVANQQKLVLLKSKLPVSVQRLNWIMINIFLLELQKNQADQFPQITLDNIYISQDETNSLPYIKTYVITQIPYNVEKSVYIQRQIIELLKLFNYKDHIWNQNSLKGIQDELLKTIGYFETYSTNFSQTFQEYLKINWLTTIHHQHEVSIVDKIKTPSFVLNADEEEIVMKTYLQDQQQYLLREVKIIEQFNSPHLPKLYSYIRYSNILILFLKRHKKSFNQLIATTIGPRKNKNINQSTQRIYQGYIKIYYSMVIALENLHFLKVVHRDIKPDNIMFDFEGEINNLDDLLSKNITCVLIDYDRSKQLIYNIEQLKTYYEGNQKFCPPEMVQQNYDYSYDIWQLGFIWMLFLKQDVVKEPKNLVLIDSIQPIFQSKLEYQQFDQEKEQINPNLYEKFIKTANSCQNYIEVNDILLEIISKMMKLNPIERPKLSAIKQQIELLQEQQQQQK